MGDQRLEGSSTGYAPDNNESSRDRFVQDLFLTRDSLASSSTKDSKSIRDSSKESGTGSAVLEGLPPLEFFGSNIRKPGNESAEETAADIVAGIPDGDAQQLADDKDPSKPPSDRTGGVSEQPGAMPPRQSDNTEKPKDGQSKSVAEKMGGNPLEKLGGGKDDKALPRGDGKDGPKQQQFKEVGTTREYAPVSDSITGTDTTKTMTDRMKSEAKVALGLKPNASDSDLTKALDDEVQALGADTFLRRQQAIDTLRKVGPAATEALARAAINSPDAEIRQSSNRLLVPLTASPMKVQDQAMKLRAISKAANEQADNGKEAPRLRKEFFEKNKDVATLTPSQKEDLTHVATVLNKVSKEYAGKPEGRVLDSHVDLFRSQEKERNLLPINFGSSLTGKAYQDFRINLPNRCPASDANVRDSLDRAMSAYPGLTGNHVFNDLAQKLDLGKDPKFVRDYMRNGGDPKVLQKRK